MLREQFHANVVALNDQDSQRDGLRVHAAAETDHGFAAGEAELDLGKRNDRGIADSNGFSDHAADVQLRNQLVELGQRLCQRSLGTRTQRPEKEGKRQQKRIARGFHDGLLTWRASCRR
ncbi:MAG: hypothetical protein ABSG26_09670 [Bryobacteraceae bacterium]